MLHIFVPWYIFSILLSMIQLSFLNTAWCFLVMLLGFTNVPRATLKLEQVILTTEANLWISDTCPMNCEAHQSVRSPYEAWIPSHYIGQSFTDTGFFSSCISHQISTELSSGTLCSSPSIALCIAPPLSVSVFLPLSVFPPSFLSYTVLDELQPISPIASQLHFKSGSSLPGFLYFGKEGNQGHLLAHLTCF